VKALSLPSALCVLALALSACATIDRATIADRLEKFGLSRDRAVCMAGELDDRLDDKQLGQFARFVSRLEKADTVLEARRSLRQVEDPKIARAVTASFFSCAV
jgi:hypothetical protein